MNYCNWLFTFFLIFCKVNSHLLLSPLFVHTVFRNCVSIMLCHCPTFWKQYKKLTNITRKCTFVESEYTDISEMFWVHLELSHICPKVNLSLTCVPAFSTQDPYSQQSHLISCFFHVPQALIKCATYTSVRLVSKQDHLLSKANLCRATCHSGE